MSRIAYVNGLYQPVSEARVSIEDRGYQFGDGVYEVCEVLDGDIIDLTRHLDRLERSLAALEIPMPMSRGALTAVFREIGRRNGLTNGSLYLQVTRGVAPRDHYFPARPVRPAIVVVAKRSDQARIAAQAEAGIAAITQPDNRWERVDIKTIGLLPNVLAKEAARRAGAREAFLVDRDGFITEGGSSNVWIVHGHTLITRPASPGILKGITRAGVVDAATALGLAVEERAFTVADALGADEVFVTSATNTVMPVVRLDGNTIGNGLPGPQTRLLRGEFHHHSERTPIY
ncbi:D-amino-acid transaminase [Pseudoxanthobacter sp.]|uniref:D-amino-acid transaminase n=1 Tax=Pseudoxanthobacter sp. TaxID=1925742 RepID=UPI002FE0E444